MTAPPDATPHDTREAEGLAEPWRWSARRGYHPELGCLRVWQHSSLGTWFWQLNLQGAEHGPFATEDEAKADAQVRHEAGLGLPEAHAYPPARYAITHLTQPVAPLDAWPTGSARMASDGGWCWWPDVERLLADRDRLVALVQRERDDSHALMTVLGTRTRHRDEMKAQRDAALSDLARLREEAERRVRAAYLAGFNVSGEGWNGEYPFQDYNRDPEADPDWLKTRDSTLARLVAHDRREAALTELARLGQEWDAAPPTPETEGGAQMPRPAPQAPADDHLAPAPPETAPHNQQPSTGDRETP